MTHEYPSPDSWDPPKPPRGSGKGWWRRAWERVTRRFRTPWVAEPFPPTLKMPTLLDVHEPSEDFSFETPALGGAYNFTIRVRCSWTVQATASEEETEQRTAEIREFIASSRAITRDRIEERVRPIARTFAPHHAAEAEEELRKAISDCLNDGDVRVTVRTWVDVADQVREDLQQVWHDRLLAVSASKLEGDIKKAEAELQRDLQLRQIDLAGEAKKAHIELLRELQQAWRELLVDGLVGFGAVEEAEARWLAPYALKLAEDPENAAGYLKTALDTRVSHAEQLLNGLDALAMDNRVEAIEFAFQSQSVLHKLLMYLGLPVPAPQDTAEEHANA